MTPEELLNMLDGNRWAQWQIGYSTYIGGGHWCFFVEVEHFGDSTESQQILNHLRPAEWKDPAPYVQFPHNRAEIRRTEDIK